MHLISWEHINLLGIYLYIHIPIASMGMVYLPTWMVFHVGKYTIPMDAMNMTKKVCVCVCVFVCECVCVFSGKQRHFTLRCEHHHQHVRLYKFRRHYLRFLGLQCVCASQDSRIWVVYLLGGGLKHVYFPPTWGHDPIWLIWLKWVEMGWNHQLVYHHLTSQVVWSFCLEKKHPTRLNYHGVPHKLLFWGLRGAYSKCLQFFHGFGGVFQNWVVATQIFVIFTPYTWGNDPIWRAYCSNGWFNHQLENYKGMF